MQKSTRTRHAGIAPEAEVPSGPQLQAGPVTIGGRTFVPVAEGDISFGQEAYMKAHCDAAGLGHLAGGLDPARPLDDTLQEIVNRIVEAGRLFQVLAGAYVERGKPWTTAGAADVARLFEGATDPTVKRALWDAVAAVVLGFFVTAASASGISLSSFRSRRDLAATSTESGEAATSETSPS